MIAKYMDAQWIHSVLLWHASPPFQRRRMSPRQLCIYWKKHATKQAYTDVGHLTKVDSICVECARHLFQVEAWFK